MTDLLVGAVLILGMGGLGVRVLGLVGAAPRDPGDRALAAFVVGNVAFGWVGLTLAATQLLRPAVSWVAVVAGVLVGAVPFVRALRESAAGARPRAATEWALAALCVGYVALVLVVVLAPLTGGDQTKYQLMYPKLYAAAGGLVPTPWTFWGQQQFLQNFAYAVAFSIGTEGVACLVNAAGALVAVAGAGRLTSRYLAPGWGWVAAALLLTQPMTWTMFRASGADTAVLAATVLAVGGLLRWTEHGRASDLRSTALIAGCAGGVKVMGLLTPGLLGLAILMHLRRARFSDVVRTAAVFGVIAAVVAAPPYLRNLVETGNPIQPFGQSVFEGAHWTTEGADYLAEYYRQYRTERAAFRAGVPYEGVAVVRFPWDLTMYPESFARAAREALDVGPAMLALLPFGFWAAWRARSARFVLGIGLAYMFVIAVGAWAHPRYVLPGIHLVVIAGLAGAVRRLDGRAIAALVAITIAGHLAVTARFAAPRWPDQFRVVAGVISRDAFLQKYSDRYRFWRAANAAIGPGETVLVLGKIPHPYYIERPFVLGSYLEQTEIDYRALSTVEALEAAIRERDIDYVALKLADLGRGADAYEAAVVARWKGLAGRLGPPVVATEAFSLHAMSRSRAQ